MVSPLGYRGDVSWKITLIGHAAVWVESHDIDQGEHGQGVDVKVPVVQLTAADSIRVAVQPQ